MPRWMRDAAFYDLGTFEDGDLSPEWPKFLNDLNKTPGVRRVPFMVEDLPANFVHRSREFDQLIALLFDRTLEGHSDYVWCCTFSPDVKLIVSASSDQTLKVWDAMTGQHLATFYADGRMLCCAVHGDRIVAGGVRGVYFLRLVQ